MDLDDSRYVRVLIYACISLRGVGDGGIDVDIGT